MTPPCPTRPPQFSSDSVDHLLTAGAAAAAPWQLCFSADPGAHSLALLFNSVRLPAGASLRFCPAAPFTASCTELGAGGLLAWVPGSTAILSFSPGICGAAGAAAELAAVLQGVQPLPGQPRASATAAAQRKAASADRQAALQQALSDVQDTSNTACPYLDIACAGSEWREPAAAVVLLLLASPKGRYCPFWLVGADGRACRCVRAEQRSAVVAPLFKLIKPPHGLLPHHALQALGSAQASGQLGMGAQSRAHQSACWVLAPCWLPEFSMPLSTSCPRCGSQHRTPGRQCCIHPECKPLPRF